MTIRRVNIEEQLFTSLPFCLPWLYYIRKHENKLEIFVLTNIIVYSYKFIVVILVNLENLFSLLQPRGISKKLSQATGISVGNISDWKKGRSKPTAEALILVADFFGVSVDYLLDHSVLAETKKDDSTEALSSAAPLSSTRKQLIEFAESLTEDEIKKVLSYIRFVVSERE